MWKSRVGEVRVRSARYESDLSVASSDGEEAERENNVAVVYPCGEPPISSDSFAYPADDLAKPAASLVESYKTLVNQPFPVINGARLPPSLTARKLLAHVSGTHRRNQMSDEIKKPEELEQAVNDNAKVTADNLAANESKRLNTKEELNTTELEKISGGTIDPTRHYPIPKFH